LINFQPFNIKFTPILIILKNKQNEKLTN